MLNRNIAPKTFPLSVPALLPYERIKLSNGIEVVYIHDPTQEVFKMDVLFEAGVYYQSQPLIASTAINMLNEGTQRHNAEQIADLFDFYGAYTDFNCGLNRSELSLISLNKYAEPTIDMLAEMLTDSIIPDKELEIFLTNRRQEFLVNNEKTSYLARKKFSGLLFGESHPYANQVSESDYTHLSSPVIREFYRQYLNADQCQVVICGNVSEIVLQSISRQLGSLSHPATPRPFHTHSFAAASPGRYHVEKKNTVQTSVRIGKSGLRITDEDYAEFLLLNTILGGYFGSRLMSNIREEKGYTYGISSFNVSMPEGSYWCVATEANAQHADAAIDETLKEIRSLQTKLVGEDELGLVKNFLHGDLLRELDGVFSQSDALKHKLNYGLDNRIYAEMINKIKKCTPENLLQLANKYWKIEDMYIVTAGK